MIPWVKYILLLLVAGIPNLVSGAGIESGSSPFDISMDLCAYSKYAWRGIVLTDGPVFQPSATIARDRLSINLWGNMNMTSANSNKNEFNEFDVTVDYSFSTPSLSISSGIINYSFPNTSYSSSTEIYASLTTNRTGNASLTVYQDVSYIGGTYISIGNAVSIGLRELTEIEVSGTINFGSSQHNNEYYGVDKNAITDFNLTASAPFTVFSSATLVPSVSFYTLINKEIREEFNSIDVDRDVLYGGLTLSFTF